MVFLSIITIAPARVWLPARAFHALATAPLYIQTKEFAYARAIVCSRLVRAKTLFEQLGLSGGFTVKSAHSSDTTRLYHAKRKSSDRYKITRKRLRAEKKGFIDTKNEEEGNVYESGAH